MSAPGTPDVASLAEREARFPGARPHRPGRPDVRPPARPPRRWWLAVVLVALAWAATGMGFGDGELVNPGGWPLVRRFLAAATSPRLDGTFLRLVVDATATTAAYAVLGTALSTAIGLVGGVVLSETWWRREGRGRRRSAVAGTAVRLAFALPRGVHEAVWGLALVLVLGLDPLVAVLAIGIPFGAVTAKVYAELLDEHAGAAHRALRAGGAGRLTALAYAVVPSAAPDLVSYGFYRLECSVRAAVVLGIIGAGGLGFQLALSFQSLRYAEMWTLIAALAALSQVTDWWGARLRRRPGPAVARRSAGLAAVLAVLAVAHLDLDVSTLWAPRTRELAARLAGEAWPPVVRGGWGELLRLSLETLQMSLVATTVATGVASALALAAARGTDGRHRVRSAAVRAVLLLSRATPPPVWALLLLFVLQPGPLPGALALAAYNVGILGRLLAEVVEDLDPRPAAALAASGAGAVERYAYATLPQALPRFAAYALYRWEVATRETVIVGVVGAGGLGRRLAEDVAAFDHAGMVATIGALVAVTVVVDLSSRGLRRRLR